MGTVGIVTEMGLLVPVPTIRGGLGNTPVGSDNSTMKESELVKPPDTEKCTSKVAPVHTAQGTVSIVSVQGGVSVSGKGCP